MQAQQSAAEQADAAGRLRQELEASSAQLAAALQEAMAQVAEASEQLRDELGAVAGGAKEKVSLSAGRREDGASRLHCASWGQMLGSTARACPQQRARCDLGAAFIL